MPRRPYERCFRKELRSGRHPDERHDCNHPSSSRRKTRGFRSKECSAAFTQSSGSNMKSFPNSVVRNGELRADGIQSPICPSLRLEVGRSYNSAEDLAGGRFRSSDLCFDDSKSVPGRRNRNTAGRTAGAESPAGSLSRPGYTPEQGVALIRHHIRSPVSGNGSQPGSTTPHGWFAWSSNPSEQSLRGGILETESGRYFRKWLEAEDSSRKTMIRRMARSVSARTRSSAPSPRQSISHRRSRGSRRSDKNAAVVHTGRRTAWKRTPMVFGKSGTARRMNREIRNRHRDPEERKTRKTRGCRMSPFSESSCANPFFTGRTLY